MNGAALAVLFIPSIAAAQQPQQKIELGTIVVEGDRSQDNGNEGGPAQAAETGTGPVNGYVATKSTTGSKTDTRITAIPQSVSVVGREEIDDRKALKVDEILRYTAGVNTSAFGGPDPDTDWFYIRGFDATQTGVFLDGMQLYSYGFGGFQIDPFTLERVEVLKGPASVLYGGANPGGIINLVSKRPTFEDFGYVELGVNNWGNAYIGGDFGGVSGEQKEWSWRFTGRIAGGDQYTDYSEDLRGTVLPQITYKPNDATTLTLYAQYSALDQIHIGGGFLPYNGTVVSTTFGKIPRDAFLGEPDIDNQSRWHTLVGYELEHEFDNGWTINHNARYGHVKNEERGPYTYGYYNQALDLDGDPFTYPGGNTSPVGSPPNAPGLGNALFRIAFEHETEVDTVTTDTRMSREFDTGFLNHRVLAGLDYRYFLIDHVQSSGLGGGVDPFNPVYGQPQVINNPNYIDQELEQQVLGFYGQDQIRFGGGWLITLNGRYDYVNTEATGTPALAGDDGALSGRAGFAYEFDNGITPYVSAATFFNPLVGTTFAGALFEPEEGEQYEVGVKYRPTFVDALITASLFDLTKQNATVNDPDHLFQQIQTGEVRSRGFELEGKANITESLKVLAAFTAFDIDVTKDTNAAVIGKTPTTVPEVTASLWVDYAIRYGVFEGVSFGAGMRYQGETWANAQNTLKVPDAVLADAAIRYERDDWGVSLNVTNLFDKEYVKGCGSELQCGYGDSRTITLSAHYKW